MSSNFLHIVQNCETNVLKFKKLQNLFILQQKLENAMDCALCWIQTCHALDYMKINSDALDQLPNLMSI